MRTIIKCIIPQETWILSSWRETQNNIIMFVCAFISCLVCVCVCVCVYIYVCMCVCIYVCMYVWLHLLWFHNAQTHRKIIDIASLGTRWDVTLFRGNITITILFRGKITLSPISGHRRLSVCRHASLAVLGFGCGVYARTYVCMYVLCVSVYIHTYIHEYTYTYIHTYI